MRERHRATPIGAAALASAVLLTVACTAARRPGTGLTSNQAAATAAAQRRVLAARYLAIATAGNRDLERDLDRLEAGDRGDLTAARADLRDAAATERLFDRRLLGIAFPPSLELTARALAQVNESRASLTAAAAISVSLQQLRRYERQLSTANGPVEEQVRILRSQLALPPPETD